jgi:hypothetical protein
MKVYQLKMNHWTALMACWLIVIGHCSPIKAQKVVEVEAQAELTSKYLWRGLEKGGISIQPSVKLSWQNAYFSAFGSKSFDKDNAEEIDLTIGYKAPFGLNISISDYWQTGIEPNDVFFEYRKKKNTAHRLEGNLGYSCKYFSLQAYCIFYGHDFKIDNGKQAYSTYIELAAPFRLSGLDWTFKAGMTPMESAGEKIVSELGYALHYTYADGPACVLASLRATKNLPLRGAVVPVYFELNTNPYLKKMHVLGGVAIKLTK